MRRRDFSVRASAGELMDEPGVSQEDLQRALEDLAAVNRLTLGYRPTLGFLRRVARAAPRTRPLRVLDVACGSGDGLRQVARWATRTGWDVELTGLDVNRATIEIAKRAWTEERPVSWVAADVLSYEPPEAFDVVVSSLFAHHLTNAQIVRFLTWMNGVARYGWFVNDLHRHPVPYHSFRLLSAAFRWHHFVRHDGPVSIARAFERDDWTRLLRSAGLDEADVRVRWWAPFRLCVERLCVERIHVDRQGADQQRAGGHGVDQQSVGRQSTVT